MKALYLSLMLLFLAGLNFAQNVPAYVPTNGLVGWWPFSGNAIDSSGNGNNGTVNNGVVLTTDRFGISNAAYDFDGIDDYISATPSLPTGSSPRTVSCWFKTTAGAITTSQYPNYQTMTGWGNPFAGAVVYPQHVVAPTGRAYFESGSGGNQLYSQNAVNDGQWHNIVTTYAGAGTRVKIYIDGIIQDSSAATTLGTANSYFGIGNAPWANIPFRGQIDDVGLWNRALTEAEISDLYFLCQVSISQPISQTVFAGNNAQFVVSSSNSNSTFQWQTDLGTGFVNVSNSGQYSGANNDTLLISNLTTANNNQQFRCIITSGACTDTTNIASLTICNEITTQPQSQTVLNGTNAQFVTSIQDPGATYQWQTDLGFGFLNLSNSGQYNGVSNDTLTISNVSTANNNQQFRCIINTGTCSDTSDVVVLSVNSSTATSMLYDHSVNIYPNPNSGEFEISISENLLGTGYFITDYLGNRISRGILNKIQNDITIEELASGVYFLQLDKKSDKIFKIIKL